LADVIATNWQKAARLYTRFEITEAEFGHGVPTEDL